MVRPDDLLAPAIECHGLTKDYGSGAGLFDLDLAIARGEVFGFIGPNGAGKTTAIRLLMNLIAPDRGSARIFGLDTRRHSTDLKRQIGYLPGELPQYPGMRAGQVLLLLANLRGGLDQRRINDLADRFDVDLSRKYADLSHGNKQKVGLVQAFMHDPELLILDEPTLGLDPLMQREFRTLVRERATTGSTVLLSSHILGEVQLACDRIGLIRSGRLLRAGTLDELRSVKTHRLEAVLGRRLDPADVAQVPGVSDVQLDGDRLTCAITGDMRALLEMLASAGTREFDSAELSLEEVFLAEYGPET